MIKVEAIKEQKLIHAVMEGFLSPEDVADFSRQEQCLATEMGCRSGEFLLLIDTICATIQSPEVVAGFMHIVASSPLKAGRIAVVRGTSLTRMQAERILKIRDNAAIFSTMEDAKAWLFAADASAPLEPIRAAGAVA